MAKPQLLTGVDFYVLAAAFKYEPNPRLVEAVNKGVVLLTEASTKKRAAMHVLRGRSSLEAMNARGLDVLVCSEAEFRERLLSENRTVA